MRLGIFLELFFLLFFALKFSIFSMFRTFWIAFLRFQSTDVLYTFLELNGLRLFYPFAYVYSFRLSMASIFPTLCMVSILSHLYMSTFPTFSFGSLRFLSVLGVLRFTVVCSCVCVCSIISIYSTHLELPMLFTLSIDPWPYDQKSLG